MSPTVSSEEEKRRRIIDLKNADVPVGRIADIVKVDRKTVSRVWERYKASGTVERKATATHNKKRTEEFLANLENEIKDDPGKSMRAHAREKGVAERTIRRAVSDLGLKSYGRQVKQLLTTKNKESRVERCGKILNFLKHVPKATVKIFSDKKVFTVDQAFNRRNDRWICCEPSDAPPVARTKHPQSVMVLGVIGSDGRKMPPVFFPGNERVNGAKYLEILTNYVLPWIKDTYGNTGWVFQQDGAPCHTANIVQNWMAANMEFWPKNFWPPQSPDLNPLDYGIWGILDGKVRATPHRNVDDLKAKIMEEWEAMEEAIVAKTCKSFRKRIEACIEANGGYIE